jgi:biotin operon repressor
MKLWIEQPHATLPMTARAYATSIMEDLREAGFDIPLETKQGYTTQDVITAIVDAAMQAAAEQGVV